MQKLVFFLEKPMLDTEDDVRPLFGSPEKIYNSFLNHCVITEDDGFEIQSINYLCNFSEATNSVQRFWQEYVQKFSWTINIRGSGKS